MPSSSDRPDGSAGTPADGPTDPSKDTPPDTLAEDYVPDHGLPRLSRLNVALLALSVVAMSAALYLSPMGQRATADVRESVADAVPGTSRLLSVPPSTSASPSATPATAAKVAAPLRSFPTAAGSTGSTGSTGPTVGGTGTGALAGLTGRPDGNASTGQGGSTASGQNGGGSGAKPGKPTQSAARPKAKTKCWQFTWQQDAQVVYLANLSDPYGLDGGKGPYNGDGRACSHLPVDPSRPASTPAGAYVAPRPSTATKQALVHPQRDYFGFSQDGIPGDTTMLRSLATKADKAPSSVGWFSSFDETYRGDLVEKSWQGGALPVVTWMPVETGSGNSYSLSRIINGEWDAYLRRFAGDVVREDLPVAIRFAHEMNGNWYGWSAGMTSYNNTPAKYVAAWQHIWKVFDEVGANDNVIWLWSPSRVDSLRVTPTNGLSELAADYPGDQYVDWVGASVYLRYQSLGPTYESAFGRTVDQLSALTDKPIFFAETAAVQSDAGTDLTQMKAAWIRDVLDHFAGDPRIVGFLWFNNVATIPVNGQPVSNDWRVDSSPDALQAFQEAIADPAFASGVLPD